MEIPDEVAATFIYPRGKRYKRSERLQYLVTAFGNGHLESLCWEVRSVYLREGKTPHGARIALVRAWKHVRPDAPPPEMPSGFFAAPKQAWFSEPEGEVGHPELPTVSVMPDLKRGNDRFVGSFTNVTAYLRGLPTWFRPATTRK
jgi:hypothetical protein